MILNYIKRYPHIPVCLPVLLDLIVRVFSSMESAVKADEIGHRFRVTIRGSDLLYSSCVGGGLSLLECRYVYTMCVCRCMCVCHCPTCTTLSLPTLPHLNAIPTNPLPHLIAQAGSFLPEKLPQHFATTASMVIRAVPQTRVPRTHTRTRLTCYTHTHDVSSTHAHDWRVPRTRTRLTCSTHTHTRLTCSTHTHTTDMFHAHTHDWHVPHTRTRLTCSTSTYYDTHTPDVFLISIT